MQHIPLVMIAISVMSPFLPFGPGEMYFVVVIVTLTYTEFMTKTKIDKIYYWLAGYLLLLSIYALTQGAPTKDTLMILLVWMHPYIGVKMQSANRVFQRNSNVLKINHIKLLSILYISYIIRSVVITGSLTGMTFHSSSLALMGTILALEILQKTRNKYKTILAVMLLAMPLIGALRQFLYIIVPIIIFLIRDINIRRRIIKASIIIALLMIITPLGSQLSLLRSATVDKAPTFQQFIEGATNPEEGTLNTRTEWWKEVFRRTTGVKFFIGHVLDYRFSTWDWDPEPQTSVMLHSYYIAAYADGGIILLILVVGYALKNIIEAVKNRDFYMALILYTFFIVFSMNASALTYHNAFVLFYIYGYYDIELRSKRKTVMRRMQINT